MENEKSLIENYLYIDYERSYKLKMNKHNYLTYLFEIVTKLNLSMEEFINENELLKQILSSCEEEKLFFDLFSFIQKIIVSVINENFSFVTKISDIISKFKESLEAHFYKYEDFFPELKKFGNLLTELNSYQNNFDESAKKAELFTINFLKRKLLNQKVNLNEYDEKEKLKKTTKEGLEKYKFKIIDVNKELNILYQKQENILNVSKELETNFNKYYFDLIDGCNEYIKNIINKISNEDENIENIKNSIKTGNNISRYDLKNYHKKDVIFIQYHSPIKFDNFTDGTIFSAYFLANNEMKDIIGDYREFEFEEENKKSEIAEDLTKILNLDDKMTDKDQEKILELVENDTGINIFIVVLNKLRTTGFFKKSELFINFISKILNIILESAEKNNNYDQAKYCIILSETFYYSDMDKKKTYIIDLIQKNKWLKSSKFWRGFMDIQIKKELEKFSKSTKKILSDILFNQLLTYNNNMKNFHVDDRIIIKIIDEFLEKYNYLDEESYKNLFNLISNMEEAEKLRKEYKENPDLENQLYG